MNKPLTEQQWREVFTIRCRSKQGHPLTDAEQALIHKAFQSDPKRYKGLDHQVFVATAPFGSVIKE